jgi:hypothetical protein
LDFKICLLFTRNARLEALISLAIFMNNQVKNEIGRAYSTHGDKSNAYRILVEKPEVKRPLGKPRRRWENNIKLDLREIGWDGMDWIDLTQDRDRWRAIVNTVMNLVVP